MRKYKRLALFILVFFSMTLLAGCGGGGSKEPAKQADKPEFTIKFAHVVSASTPKGQAADRFAELIEERTDGRIVVEVFPDSQLGDDGQITEQMRMGTIQMNAPFTGVLPAFVPQAEFFDLPFLFPSTESVYNALHGEVGEIFNGYLEEIGLRVLGYWDGGFKHFTNSKRPIVTPEDLKGLKFRVSQSPLLSAQFEALGAQGISISFNELYTALSQGTVDGQENVLANIYSRKFYEAQPYMTLSGHGYLGYVLMVSEDFYQSLPEDLQQILVEVAQEVTEWQWQIAAEQENGYLEAIREAGVEIVELTPEQKQAFREATASVYDVFAEIEGSEDLIKAFENIK